MIEPTGPPQDRRTRWQQVSVDFLRSFVFTSPEAKSVTKGLYKIRDPCQGRCQPGGTDGSEDHAHNGNVQRASSAVPYVPAAARV